MRGGGIQQSSLNVICDKTNKMKEPLRVSDLKKVLHDYSSERGWNMLTIGIAEFWGTGILVFFTCMASVYFSGGRHTIDPKPEPFHKAISCGLVVAAVIQLIGHISAAHLNPAVTLTAYILGKIKADLAAVYVIAECAGGLVGFGLLQVLTPYSGTNFEDCDLCITSPNGNLTTLQAVVIEGVATSVLILMVCATWDPRNSDKQDSVPLKFGFFVTIIAFMVGPYTGGSMNPARSLAPAVWKGYWKDHWIYWVGPLLSSLITSLIYRYFFGRKYFPATPSEVSTQDEAQLQDKDLKEVRF